MYKEIYFVRHGETENNRLKIWSGCSEECNLPLNNRGRVQALKAANIFNKYALDAVYCSKLYRAAEVGNILSCRLNIPCFLKDGLHEVDYGQADGMLIKDVWSKMPDMADKFINMRPEYFSEGFPGGETLDQSLSRTLYALQEIIKEPYRRVAVVSHAGLMSVLLCYLGMDTPRVPNCSFIKIIYDGEFRFVGEVITPDFDN